MSYGRKDNSHKSIVDGLAPYGIVAFDVSALKGLGFDVVLYRAATDTWRVAELKTPFVSQAGAPGKRKYSVANRPVRQQAPLTESELRAQKRAPIPVVHDLVEALALFGLSE